MDMGTEWVSTPDAAGSGDHERGPVGLPGNSCREGMVKVALRTNRECYSLEAACLPALESLVVV